jgi:bifunctional non-homologous end joining protein LigD
MLPCVANRPLTLVRCERPISSPDALRHACRFLPHEPGWYEWANAPIRRLQIQEQKKVGEYLVVDSAEALVALVQGDIIEIHVWNSTVDSVEAPDRIVLDLDPGDGVSWTQLVAGALHVRELVASLGLDCWPKLTGGKGVHVVVPCLPEHGWDQIYALSHRLAQAALERDPIGFTLDFAKAKRPHKILEGLLALPPALGSRSSLTLTTSTLANNPPASCPSTSNRPGGDACTATSVQFTSRAMGITLASRGVE